MGRRVGGSWIEGIRRSSVVPTEFVRSAAGPCVRSMGSEHMTICSMEIEMAPAWRHLKGHDPCAAFLFFSAARYLSARARTCGSAEGANRVPPCSSDQTVRAA